MKKSLSAVTMVAIGVLLFVSGMFAQKEINIAGLSTAPATHTQCVGNGVCVVIPGAGSNQCTFDGTKRCPAPAAAAVKVIHGECLSGSCILVNGAFVPGARKIQCSNSTTCPKPQLPVKIKK